MCVSLSLQRGVPNIFTVLLHSIRLSLGTQQRTLAQINSELEVKTNSLAIDQKCMEEREKLKAHPSGEELIKHVA